jgi:hypothetical protein
MHPQGLPADLADHHVVGAAMDEERAERRAAADGLSDPG